jgi:DNA polymerase III subunit gamma/tau
MEIQKSNLATRYRPQKLSDLVGQDNVKKQIEGMIKSKSIPSALLITGATGCGKTTISRLIHRYINCDTLSACGECPSCKIPVEGHPDYIERNAADSRGIDDIRSIISQSNIYPQYNMRIFVLDEAHQLTSHAFNAFLKPLESPPPNTLYIIATTDLQSVPDTIVNRCVPLHLTQIKLEDIYKRIKFIAKSEGIKVSKDIIHSIADNSGGHLRQAIQLLENVNFILKSNSDISDVELQNLAFNQEKDVNKIAIKLLIALYSRNKLHKVVTNSILNSDNIVQLLNSCIFLHRRYLDYTYVNKNCWKPANFIILLSTLSKYDIVVKANLFNLSKALGESRQIATYGDFSKDIILGKLMSC